MHQRNEHHGDDDFNLLCCCEYISVRNERSHLLGCCCDCTDVDEAFERAITRQAMPNNTFLNIYHTVQDRCRIPWLGGARIIPLDVALAILLQPALACIASINCWCTLVVFLALPFILCYFIKIFDIFKQETKFFYTWTLASCVFLMSVFEFLVVPQLEILPGENCVFMALVILAFLFIYSTKNSFVKSMGEYCDAKTPMTSINRICTDCSMRHPVRTMHCTLCAQCTLKGEYHCKWLDCCIGGKNLMKFIIGLTFVVGSLSYGSYLTLTTVCHPFLFMDIVLIPDDCSDVYFDFHMALCFVSGAYSLLVCGVLCYVIAHHCWLAGLGLTYSEWLQLPPTERRCFGLKTSMPYSRGAFANLKELISV